MAIIYPFPPYSAYTWNTPVVPKLYWDVYSQEQRMKALCMEYAKLIAYNSDLADTLNNYVEVVNTLQQQLPELVNEDVVAEINRLVITGEFAEMVHDAIEQLTTDVQDQLDALNTAIENEGTNRLNADNALQAQIDKIVADRKGTYVTYEDFGAKLDGTTDDSAAIIACHEYANENGVPVVQIGGLLKANFNADVKTDCNLQIELLVDADTPQRVYNIVPDSAQDFEYTGTVSQTDNQAYVESLKGMSAAIKNENDAWSLGTRSGTSEEIFHTQELAWDQQGFLITSPVFVPNEGTFTFTNVHSLYEKAIAFEGLNISVDKNGQAGFYDIIYCSRNNTTIKNITCTSSNLPIASSTSVGFGLFEIDRCCNVTVENIFANNNSSQPASYWSYVFYARRTFNVKFINCVTVGGWGCVGSHFNDCTTFDKCVSNRFDNHYGVFGYFNIANCELNGIAEINVGYGNANVVIQNTVFNPTIHSFYRIGSRDDFAYTFSGKYTIDNCTFNDIEDDNNNNNVIILASECEAYKEFPYGNPTVTIENQRYEGNRCVAHSDASHEIRYLINNYYGTLTLYGRTHTIISNSFINNLIYSNVPANALMHFIGCVLTQNMTTNITCNTKFRSCNVYGLSNTASEITMTGSYIQANSTLQGNNWYFAGNIFAAPATTPTGTYTAKGNIGLADTN